MSNHIMRLIKLNWIGPFAYGPRGIEASKFDSHATEIELKKHLGKPGIYIVIGDHPIHGSRSLLYIGRSSRLERRLDEHYNWIAEEWRVEIYLAVIKKKKDREYVESLLIHAHSPAYNSKNIESINIAPSIQIWNQGRFWRLFPEISSDNPWYENISKRRIS